MGVTPSATAGRCETRKDVKKRRLTPDDHFRMAWLGGADLSPDGKTAVYMVKRTVNVGAAGERDVSTLWRLDIGAGPAVALTDGAALESTPVFSPDGRSIAFLSDRDGAPQVFVLDLAASHRVRRVTDAPCGVAGHPVWSPDGARIAYAAGVVAETTPAGIRTRRTVHRAEKLGSLDSAHTDLFVVAVDGRSEATRLTDHGGITFVLDWAPDGEEILIGIGALPDERYPEVSLNTVDLLGHLRCVKPELAELLPVARYGHDGRHILYLDVPDNATLFAALQLWVMDRDGGGTACRTAGHDRPVSGMYQLDTPVNAVAEPRILLVPGVDEVITSRHDGLAVYPARIGLSGSGAVTPVFEGPRACFAQAVSANRLLFIDADTHSGPDLYLWDFATDSETRLTDLNADLNTQIAFPKAEPFHFGNRGGGRTEGLILSPPGAEPPFPTVLYIHGGPMAAFGYGYAFDFQMLAGAGYAVVTINSRGSTGYGDAHMAAIHGRWGEPELQDFLDGLDMLAERGVIDETRIGVCGISGGGHLTAWAVTQTHRFKAAVAEQIVADLNSYYGTSDLGAWLLDRIMGGPPHVDPDRYWRYSPASHAHKARTPTLILQGEDDIRCPIGQGQQFYAQLRHGGCEAEFWPMAGCSHGGTISGPPHLRRAQNDALLGWFHAHMPPDEAA